MLSFTVGALIAATAATGLVPATQPGDALAAIQDRAAQAIDVRDDSLALAADRVDANKYLTDAHREQLNATISSTRSGIDAIGVEIAAATTAKQARQEFATVFTDYRVYAVVIPRAAYVGATDRLTESAIPKLEKVYAKLEPLAAKDPEAAADLATMRTALDTAAQLTDGLADDFLAVTPAAYDANHTILANLRIDLQKASVQLREAAEDAQAAVKDLR